MMRGFLLLSFFCSLLLFGEETDDLVAAAPKVVQQQVPREDGYVINYNTVSIIEYIRFASKICRVNFLYEESDLNFTVTVVSDEPVTPANVMATLVQVLRVHGLMLLEQDNNLVIHRSADVKQVATLVTEGSKEPNSAIVTRIFRVKNAKPESIAAIIQPMISTSAILETLGETRQLILTDVKANVDKVAVLIENLDSPHTLLEIKSFEVKYNKPEFLIGLASQIMTPIAQGNPFILVPQTLANEVFVVSTPDLVDKAMGVLASLDTLPKVEMLGVNPEEMRTSFFVYKPVNRSAEEIQKSLLEMAGNLRGMADQALVQTIQSVKVNSTTQTLTFTGEERTFMRVQELLATVDSAGGRAVYSPVTQFYIYKPVNQSGDQIASAVKEMAEQLKSDKLADPAFLNALGTMKWVKSTNSLLFTGDPASLQKVQTLIGTIDVAKSGKPGYYIYKVQNTTGDLIEEDLDNIAKNFKSSGLKDAKILDVIAKMRYVKQTNSLLLSGDPDAIEEVKQLIAQHDYPRSAASPSSNFYMYKPLNLSAKQIEKSLQDVGANLKSAGLADPNLLKTIDTVKYVEATNSLIFTGPPETLTKIQSLIKDIDIAQTQIQHVGKTTFLLYKLKNANGPQIVSSLKNMAAEMKKTGSTDKEFIHALNSVKYVKETQSLFFTGTEESLGKVQNFVVQFDVPSMGKSEAPMSGAPNFFVYKPQSLEGPNLEKMLSDFSEHLKSSGLADPDLFRAIDSMRWNEATKTLVFTGTPKALDQVKELLKEFDIPSNLPPGEALAGQEPSIQAIDNTSFLVYKLQFHKGDEIQGALRQIAKDLIISNAPVNQGLLNSINSIQWLEVTNSLLCSGDQETLTRLRELVKNLDIPLKQVYIEMLVIQTNLTNALQFGLEWGANYKYRDKFSGNTYNALPNPSVNATPDPFITNLSNLAAPKTPTPQMIPPSANGFDLGIIGEVIRHNGQSFLTLGSLLSALQNDDEVSVIMTPKIITQDGRTSTLFQGENIPFVGSFVSNSGSNTINTSNIEYRDIGLSLTITPVLGNSDIVTLDISLDRSQTVGDITQATLQPGAQSANGIITSKTTMQTTVHVPDNNYLILSGMVNNSNAKVKAGIPCLGGLPVIGAAFSKATDAISNSNIVIFIRPHVINSVEDMRRITTKEEDYFRDQAGTPFLERNFDEGMELIKTVDDE
jgi:type II secretory pathway component GspD/PulD (secretin)